MKRCVFALVFFSFLLTGCASVTVTKVTPQNACKDGVRYYRPWPYLLVTRDQTGKLETNNIYLPKIDEEYCIKVNSGLGTVNSSFDLTDGWQLTKMGDIRDSKIPETITALTGAASTVGPMITTKGVIKQPTLPTPGLYRYDFDEKTGFVKGLVPVFIFVEQEK